MLQVKKDSIKEHISIIEKINLPKLVIYFFKVFYIFLYGQLDLIFCSFYVLIMKRNIIWSITI